MPKRSLNSHDLNKLNETALTILAEYNERYFKEFADNFIEAWSKNGEDSYGKKLAMNFLYKAANYEEINFIVFLDENFPEPRSETQINCCENLIKISNCCHINDHEQELAEDVMEMIEHCRTVSGMSYHIMSDKISDYFTDSINSHLKGKSPLIYKAIIAENAQKILEQKQRFKPIIEIDTKESHIERILLEDATEEFSEEELKQIFSSRDDRQEDEVSSLFSSLSSDPSTSPNIGNRATQTLQKKQRVIS